MAIKHICDRCGKDIEKLQTSWITYHLEYARVRMPSCGNDPINVDAELCPECAGEFLDWINANGIAGTVKFGGNKNG